MWPSGSKTQPEELKSACVCLAIRAAAAFVLCILSCLARWHGSVLFANIPGVEYENFPLPHDYQEKTEWVFARLMYPAVPAYGYRGNPDWKHGAANWTIDYPRSDRHLSEAVRRLTRVHVRSVEQPVDLDDGDDVYNYPWLYAVEVGYWDLTDEQVEKVREYLLRGGFFMCDDFHGTQEWAVFTASMKRFFPTGRSSTSRTTIRSFTSMYDLSDRYQVPGAQYLYSGRRATRRTVSSPLARHL